jgi:hypothetical protein
MDLGAQVINLIRPDITGDPDQIAAVGEIAVMQFQQWITVMGILAAVIDPGSVETTGPTLEPMHPVSLLQQEFV